MEITPNNINTGAPSGTGLCALGFLPRVAIKFAICLLFSGFALWYWLQVDAGEDPFMAEGFKCSSGITIDGLQKMDKKGLALDDETFNCPDKIPEVWPHTDEKVLNLRLFRSTQPGWDLGRIANFALEVAKYAKKQQAKILVGTQITCDEEADDLDWAHTKTLLRYLGPDHVLGLAVGNEIDLLWQKNSTDMATHRKCVANIWGNPANQYKGYLFTKMKDRVAEFHAKNGFENLPVTSVFTAACVWPGPVFTDDDNMRVQSFLRNVLADSSMKPFAFTFNFYPYFDPNNKFDGWKHGNNAETCKDKECTCDDAMNECKGFVEPTSKNMINFIQTRVAIEALTGNRDDTLWCGEVGWSAPKADTLKKEVAPVYACEDFSGYPMLYDYYSGFLRYDMQMYRTDYHNKPANYYEGPEIMFYFSIRDSGNFGETEHFGLMSTCQSTQCKLTTSNVPDASTRNKPLPMDSAQTLLKV